MIAAFVACAVLAAALTGVRPPDRGAPPVGFIWHYPFVDVGTSLVPQSGATSMIARAPWSAIEPEPGRFDFTPLDRQLAAARAGGYRLVLRLECNPVCAPGWLRQRVREAGESVHDELGQPGDIPSTTSRLFAEAQERFVRAVTGHIRASDPDRVVSHYQPGVEWWFPYSFRHAPADVARFRAWLERRHRSLEELNEAWGSDFASWDAVQAPPVVGTGELWERGRVGMGPEALLAPERFPASRPNVAARDWLDFWTETAARTVDSLAALVRRFDPSRPTVSFLTHAFSFMAEWDYTLWSAMRPDVVLRQARHLDVFGMQLCLAEGDPIRIEAGLDLARKYGRPVWALDLQDFAAGVSIGYPAMERATHAAVQRGAAGLFYGCWNGARDFNFHPDWPIADIRRMVTEGRRAIEAVRGRRPTPTVALLHPFTPGRPGDPRGLPNHAASFLGWYRILGALGQGVDVVTLRDLETGAAPLDRYTAVVVPDCGAISAGALVRLRAYARTAGTLVLGGRFALEDETGRPYPAVARALRAVRVPDLGRRWHGRLWRSGRAGDTPPLLQAEPGDARKEAAERDARRLLGELMGRAARRAGARLEGAGRRVTCMPLGGPAGAGAYLVNHADRVESGGSLWLRASAQARLRVLADLQPVPARATRVGDGWMVQLPAFRTSCIVLADEPPARQPSASRTAGARPNGPAK
ncbi:MAG TPA: alpha-amylase family protein [Chthonomonadales bacterium]|nr:alpha-amylase family protein [Chthonomonadales bacterium]